MPKRSNSFQKIITVIENSISDAKTTVSESEVVLDNLGIEREIDVLILTNVNDTKIQIALECRDHGRDQSLEWIDQIIGKYLNINVEKVVAVSSTGFSDSAIKKAKSYNISLLSLEDVKDVDWIKLISEIKLMLFKLELGMFDWKLVTVNGDIGSDKLTTDTHLFDDEQNTVGTIESELDKNYEERGRDFIFDNFQDALPRDFDPNGNKKPIIELNIDPIQPRYFQIEQDKYIQIQSFKIFVELGIKYFKTEQNYFEYKNVPVVQMKAKVGDKEKREYGTLVQTKNGYGIRILEDKRNWETRKKNNG